MSPEDTDTISVLCECVALDGGVVKLFEGIDARLDLPCMCKGSARARARSCRVAWPYVCLVRYSPVGALVSSTVSGCGTACLAQYVWPLQGRADARASRLLPLLGLGSSAKNLHVRRSPVIRHRHAMVIKARDGL